MTMGLFGGGAPPKLKPVPATPTPDAANAAQESELQALARRRGFASNLLAPDSAGLGGLTKQATGSTKLLGG
jgi:hypothetical protein